ncbi:DNA cytosine methyltransferase [Sphaerisporangium sp. NPDC005289]|uniref:DNA cytosine methyltransferase n=1 Tax=Sphaerisporangium sp. NPDC005289 TaxID=3155247 RepID=UPI0033B189C9
MSFYRVKLHRSEILSLPVPSDACTEDKFTEWCEEKLADGGRLAVDLFSGAGGLSLGLEQAGWTVVTAVDHDRRAVETHRANFPGLSLDVDLSDIEARTKLIQLLKQTKVDLVAGGPPCQPFSRAGRSKIHSLVEHSGRDPHDARKELWRAFLDVVLAVKPRAVLMENVPDMALGDDFRVVREIVENLENVGYHTDVRLVDAWKYGVPQHRKRLIVLARNDHHEFPWPAPQKKVTVRDAIGDLPVLPEDDPVGDRRLPYRGGTPTSEFAQRMRAKEDSGYIWDHMTRPVRPDDLEVFKLMDHRTLYSAIPAELRRYSAETFDDKYKRLDWNDLSRSITAHIAKDGYWYIHPEQHRTITVREAARIQTFPDHFRFAGTRSDAFRQIGNAVPPELGRFAAQAIAPDNTHQEELFSSPNRWALIHRQLSEWATGQREGANWFYFPGPDTTATVAAVVTLLSRGGRTDIRHMAPALHPLRGLGKLTQKEYRALVEAIDDPKVAQRLGRLSALTAKQNVWRDPAVLAETLALHPAEEALLTLLSDHDLMLTSQLSLRVAARVSGSDSDKTNRLTDGRVDIARLIGGGKAAPLRMAALRVLGLTTCLPNEPLCGTCPLSRTCAFALQERPGTATLW